ncbi:uncharacterized protein LOC143226404 [Tachypleus tridentatus]|uniref:uncharacterized protein LOC143226404 n=1 Tax=Tachypleus tridentatus TaxID=6853 RepID=UPI003FD0ABA1
MLESSPKQHSRRETGSLLTTTTSVEHVAKEKLLENDAPIDLSKKSASPTWKNKDTQGSSEKTNCQKSIENDWIEKWQKIAGGVIPPMFSSYLRFAEDSPRTHCTTLNNSDKLSHDSRSASFLFPVGTLNSCPLVCDPFGNTFVLAVHPDEEHIVPVPIGSPLSNGIKLPQTNLSDAIPVSDKVLSKYLENTSDEKVDQSSKRSKLKRFSRSSNDDDDDESEQEENTCPEKNDQREKLKGKDIQLGCNESKDKSFLYSKEKCYATREVSQECCDVVEDLRVSKDTNRLEYLAGVKPQLKNSHFFGNLKNSVSCSVLSEKSPGVDHFWRERSRTNSESTAFRKHPFRSVVEDVEDKNVNSNQTLKRKASKSESEFDHLNLKRHKITLKKSKSVDMNSIDSKRNDQNLFAIDLEHYKSKAYFPLMRSFSSAQSLATVSIDASESRNQEKTFFQQLRHIYPLSFPWNIYEYYSKLIQTCQDSDVFTQLAARNIRTSDVAVKTPSPKSSPSFDKTASHENNRIVNDSQSDTLSVNVKKRVPRTLTGKHVRYGTGASLSTLQTLREKIHERQKAKEHTVLNEKLFSSESNKKKSNTKQPIKSDRSSKTKTKKLENMNLI